MNDDISVDSQILAQLTTSSYVWKQYFHTHQILSAKNYEEYINDSPLYKFHLANRISTHPLLDNRQLNEQTSATWKSLIYINLPQHIYLKDYKIQDVILFLAVTYFELATAVYNLNKYSLNQFTLHVQDISSAYVHPSTRGYQYESSVKKIKTLHGTSITIISQLSNDNNNCSSYNLLHPYVVLLPGAETTFLPVRIQKFIYSNKINIKMNQSTNIEVRGIYHDNIYSIGQ
ncbi:unnamed protein product [Adineta steineri]|nr:unnamed protein product [Adineta steineri]